MKTYEAAGYITTFSFFSTLLVNSILIYLTIFHIKHICGTYKWMIITFASIGILFSFVETTVRPNIHNFNGAFMYFSPSVYLPKWLQYIGTASISGFFCFLLSFITMQFIYRLWTLTKSEYLAWFHGIRVSIWFFFVMTPCMLYISSLIIFISPDDISDAYMEEEIMEIYDLNITEVTRFILLAWKDDKLRFRNVSFVLSSSTVMTMSLIIIVYCAFRMRREMQKCLERMSDRNRKLENQFFAALVAQSAFPFALLVIPASPVLFLPLLDLKVSSQSGVMFSIFSSYPPLDSIAMMFIIKEYKYCMRRVLARLRCCGGVKIGDSALSTQYASSVVENSIQMAVIADNVSINPMN